MKLTSWTKRIIFISIGLLGLLMIIGWAWGSIKSQEALAVLSSIVTGLFAVLRGVD